MVRISLSGARQFFWVAVSLAFFNLAVIFKALAKPPTKAAKACAYASEFFDEKARAVVAHEFGDGRNNRPLGAPENVSHQ